MDLAVRALVLAVVLGSGAIQVPAEPLVISEFLASNVSGLADEDGDREDWIEIRNVSDQPVNAGGWHLTDTPGNLTRWTLPDVTVPPGGFLVVFASGKDRSGTPPHANFSLSAAGEYLALVRPGGESIASEFSPAFPPQLADVSYGVNESGELRFFNPPTPGAPNGAGIANRVAETRFSVGRGFHFAPFDLVITCPTPGAEIRYTTNGTPPMATTGQVYSGPIRIAGTTVVRAAAFFPGWLSSAVATHTYLFPDDIVRQSPNGAPPPGWPASWGSNVRDYGMDPDIVDHPAYANEFPAALLSIPSFCVTVHLPDLFSPSQGIYANPGQDGRTWERPMSLELIHPDGREGFQINGGIRIRGGYSRSTDNPKHAFRFFFRPEYGASRLEYPVFGDGGADEFEGFDLRTFQNYSWSFEGDSRGTFMRDQFNRDLQLAMGHAGERGDYYHLYINGHYWGLYNTAERPEASYAESYFGGSKDDYDVIKVESGPYTLNATDGNMTGWTRLYNLVRGGVDDDLYQRLMGRNPDGTRNPEYPVYLDPVNLIDYMLVILYGGNLDAPISNFLGNTSPNNFFAIWNRESRDRGFQFFVHDAEHTLLDVNADRTGPYPAGDGSVTRSNPQWLWQRLLASSEFRMLAADRVHRHFFNGGVLTPEGARQIYLRRRDEIASAVVAESARWGDSRRPSSPLTRDNHWVPAVNQNLDFIRRRSPVVLQQLRNIGVYPPVEAPRFNRHGGAVEPGFELTMTAGAGAQILFTLDGSDPRLPGGGVGASAREYSGPIPLAESAVVKARARSGGRWSALNEAEFSMLQDYTRLVVSEVHYHPAGDPALDEDEFEFIELRNVGLDALDLGGVHFSDAIEFTFPSGTRVEPGGFVVLVGNADAFASRYPGVPIGGVYSGRLSNSGERIALSAASGETFLSFTYGTRSPWPRSADGDGFSLVPVDPRVVGNPDDPAHWRASSVIGGSPGADDPVSGIPSVVINEVLTHAGSPAVDAVELHNPQDEPVSIGGWGLTDDRAQPMKFRFPEGTRIPARGYLVVTESDFNSGPNGFAFSAQGEEVWLFSADASGARTGFSDGFTFGAAASGVSFGRHTNSIGRIVFPAQREVTLGAANAGPVIGPVVLNEIHYQPAGGEAEFVEIRNITDAAVPLFDPRHPGNTWRIAGINFQFPPDVTLPPGGLAVVTAGDPDSFRALHGIPENVPVFGPFLGVLQDGGERVAVERPDDPVESGDGSVIVPYVTVDEVSYQPGAPWPNVAGNGSSLERRSPPAFADDPASWRASFLHPSPGGDNDGNRPPTVFAGSDLEIESEVFPIEVSLAGSGSDDGLPVVPGTLNFEWSQVGGPGPVDFADVSRTNTTVRIPGTGEFTLRLTATDGDRARADDLVIRTRRPPLSRTLVPAGSLWRYLDDGSDPGTAWRGVTFSDSGWRSGRAQLGFGDGDEATIIRSQVGGVRTRSFYFRHSFNLEDPEAVQTLTVHLLRDDGALVYLNGTMVFRSNMPEGPVTASTFASEVVGDTAETTFYSQSVDPGLLRAGRNVIAVQVHQHNDNSTDVSFDLALDADVVAPNQPPVANAGPDRTARVGESLILTGEYQDDGLPSPPGVVSFAWELGEGPAPVQFSDAQRASTRVTFGAPGTYTLRFRVSDGAHTVSDEVRVEVSGLDYAGWRALHFPGAEMEDPAISGDDADPDGDGQSNRNEFLSGTDPRDPDSVLRVAAGRSDSGEIILSIAAAEGRTYTILQRPAATFGEWEVLRHLGPAECDCVLEVSAGIPAGAMFYQVVTPAIGP